MKEQSKKRIMILGGGPNQISLCKAAERMNYEIILCDSKDGVICKDYASFFRQIDISDPQELVKTAREMRADGIISNTESLMYALSVAQSNLQMVSNDPQAVEILIDKYLFRKELKKNHLFSPEIVRVSTYDEAVDYVNTHRLPLIMKPEKSSGSRGTYIFRSTDDLKITKFDDSVKSSRNDKVLIEGFVDMTEKKAIEAEMFVYKGKIELLCCFRTLRDLTYHTIPQCYCSATELDEATMQKIYDNLTVIVDSIGIKWGEYNVELSFNEKNEVFIIEINARQGGMRLPEFVKHYTGVDMNKLLVSTAANDDSYLQEIKSQDIEQNENVIHFRILCGETGIYKGVEINADLEKYLVEKFFYFKIGEKIAPAQHSLVSIGLLDFRFPDSKTRKKYEKNLFDEVKIIVE